ncbi:esterase family protein [Paraliomyxa miuraensis]|uniref:esterase family protein n=1 Tax=Paraliomyxa miuraensis TaxID=376150 RepID=UPI0022588E35|nr:alpha/beta hydrolase-fold protein [Paraliomyxa miuraensis]MCX4247994.1 alpha/beta hydrolase-fold protein [Paraliomyxa miuraensis]
MKLSSRWYSPRLNTEVLVCRWGHFGQPVLLFPTAGGDAEECERFLMIKVLMPLLEAGRIKIYTCDSVAGRTWTDGESPGAHRARVQNAFDSFVIKEVVPAIRQDCRSSEIEIITAGASIGAFNAFAAICRHPDVFKAAVCMSGTYDLSRWMTGQHTLDFHYSSPLHFLPHMGEGLHLEKLRERFVILATGEGRWESPGESWRTAHVLGSRGVPNRVDLWGKDHDHDWPTWREMLPQYLDKLTA